MEALILMTTNEDFIETGEMVKELGLKETLTIGIGTMIGAGIFILPRLAIGQAGPGAIVAYIFAGLLCMITAASTAELATGMPKSGGAYFFISRSMGPFMGTISGVTVWLSLTFAVAFYLRGFGEYLAYLIPYDTFLIFPINATILALLAGIFFTYINYIGAKETGKTQNIIVGILLIILALFIGWGSFNIDTQNLSPFFSEGLRPVFSVTALIFVSFLGFVQIASVAEEVKKPSYTMPRAIIGSVGIVTIMYVLVLLVTSGILPVETIGATDAPIVEAARVFSGFIGGMIITFAALLATASSANASILAASRISFALGRDSILPDWFNKIHEKYLTPSRPIFLTGILTIILILSADVALLSDSASVLMLINYSLINVAVLIMRKFPPEGYQPSYKSPGYPYLHLLGAIVSFMVIFVAGSFAQLISVFIIGSSLFWFYFQAKKKTEVKGAIEGISLMQFITQKVPDIIAKTQPDKRKTVPEIEQSEPDADYKILLPMANPKHEQSMLKLSSSLIKGVPGDGEIDIINIIKLPEQTPLDLAEYRKQTFTEKQERYQEMLTLALEYGKEEQVIVNPQIKYSRSRRNTIYNIINNKNIDFLLLGWHDPMNIVNIYNSLVKELIRKAPCPVGVFKDRGLKEINNILVPYRGSEHAYWGIQVAQNLISNKTNGQVTVLRVVQPGTDPEKEKNKALKEIKNIKSDKTKIKVVFAGRVIDGILSETINNNYDLITMGASKRWRVKDMMFGSIPDIIAEKSEVSVLMLRYYDREIDQEIQKQIQEKDQQDSKEPSKL